MTVYKICFSIIYTNTVIIMLHELFLQSFLVKEEEEEALGTWEGSPRYLQDFNTLTFTWTL
jgi:hypothetical protein